MCIHVCIHMHTTYICVSEHYGKCGVLQDSSKFNNLSKKLNKEIVSERYSVATIANDFLKSWPTISE